MQITCRDSKNFLQINFQHEKLLILLRTYFPDDLITLLVDYTGSVLSKHYLQSCLDFCWSYLLESICICQDIIVYSINSINLEEKKRLLLTSHQVRNNLLLAGTKHEILVHCFEKLENSTTREISETRERCKWEFGASRCDCGIWKDFKWDTKYVNWFCDIDITSQKYVGVIDYSLVYNVVSNSYFLRCC